MTPHQSSTLLAALAAELTDMGGAVEGLADLLMDYARIAAPTDRAAVVVRAQGSDALAQRLHALGGLTRELAAGRPVDAALDGISLADLADRLRRAVLNLDSAAAAAPASAGELALFD